MASVKKEKEKKENFDIEIGLKDGKGWDDEKLAQIKAFIKNESNNRTPERRLKNELLSIKYQMEEYINNTEDNSKAIFTLEMFLNIYLKTLNLTLKKFAQSIDTTDGNLKKYLSGERKFNNDLALKFAYFFHTTPDLWLKVQIKNELASLNEEKSHIKKYKKYDYENII